MPANIEIKARVQDFERLQEKAAQLSDCPCQVIHQEDTFFKSQHGRLKLRLLKPDFGQLIYYRRPDINGPKHSEYQIFETSNPEGLKLILAEAYGVRGVVTKTRYLYMVGQTRIHLDDVQGLGKYLELEVVLQPGQTDAEGHAIALHLMDELGISDDDLLDAAYMDLIEK
jgi:predicted adenylyl cyclase CyaB